jgi:hypothetical protein
VNQAGFNFICLGLLVLGVLIIATAKGRTQHAVVGFVILTMALLALLISGNAWF